MNVVNKEVIDYTQKNILEKLQDLLAANGDFTQAQDGVGRFRKALDERTMSDKDRIDAARIAGTDLKPKMTTLMKDLYAVLESMPAREPPVAEGPAERHRHRRGGSEERHRRDPEVFGREDFRRTAEIGGWPDRMLAEAGRIVDARTADGGQRLHWSYKSCGSYRTHGTNKAGVRGRFPMTRRLLAVLFVTAAVFALTVRADDPTAKPADPERRRPNWTRPSSSPSWSPRKRSSASSSRPSRTRSSSSRTAWPPATRKKTSRRSWCSSGF